MNPLSELLLFTLTALGLVLSPGPNMIYLILRSILRGRQAGVISLTGILSGFPVHIFLVAFGPIAILLVIPFAYETLRWLGISYSLHLAWESIKPGSSLPFEITGLPHDSVAKLHRMGFLTSALSPKIAVFYVSFFPQFPHPESRNLMG